MVWTYLSHDYIRYFKMESKENFNFVETFAEVMGEMKFISISLHIIL